MRQNVYAYDDDDETRLAGWFDPQSAESWDEGTRWDGSNHVSLATGSQWVHQRLYRTKGGRWVIDQWSQWQGSAPRTWFASADEAREWLVSNEHPADVIEAAFGEHLPSESGPGRPEVGPRVVVRLPEVLIEEIDERAEAAGQTRAAWIRAALERALG